VSDDHIRIDNLAEHVRAITINRPDQANTISLDMMRRIGAACEQLEGDPDVRVVVLRGAGRWFSAGADVTSGDLAGQPGGGPPVDFRRDIYMPILRMSKPLIGCINGAAAGGGLGLALACDMRICADTAKFATSFTRIGLAVHDNVAWLLPRVVGIPQALRLIYRPTPILANEALRIGLVEEVLPAAELEARVLALAREIAGLAPFATQLSKRLVLDAMERGIEEHMLAQEYAALANHARAQHDIVEGTTAFAEKRPAKFKGPL
jgi:enoyl-CoA hydratase/carnithine racemase